MTSTRKILQQGMLDGLCLPYSVLNAYKALLRPDQESWKFSKELLIDSHVWREIVSALPWLEYFCNGDGTAFEDIVGVEDNVRIEGVIVNSITSILSRSISEAKVRSYPLVMPPHKDIYRLLYDKISASSVVIFSITEKSKFLGIHFRLNHWLCAVDACDDIVNLACSFSPFFHAEERKSPSLYRHYNAYISREELNRQTKAGDFKCIYGNSFYEIKRG